MPNNKQKHRTAEEWAALKRKYIDFNLDQEPMTLRQFADKEGLSFGTVRNRAAQDNWLSELEDRLDFKHTKELSSLKKAHERAMMRLRSMAVNEEVSVRSRHAAHGRVLQQKGFEYFQSLDAENLKPSEAVQIMRLGIDMEKNALGLPDRLEPGNPITNPQPEIDTAARKSLKTDDVDQILSDVLESLWKGSDERNKGPKPIRQDETPEHSGSL